MEVTFARRLGRIACGAVLCSSVSLAYAADGGSVVFIEDGAVTPASTSSAGSFVVVERQPRQAATRPSGDQVRMNQAPTAQQTSMNSKSTARQGTVRTPSHVPSAAATPIPTGQSQDIIKSIAKPVPLSQVEQLLVEAHVASREAMTESELSEVIDKCVRALRLGLQGENKQFATELISWSLNKRGQAYADAGKKELADADFEEAMHFDGKNWRALHNRGVSYAESGMFAEAFDDFTRVIEMNPKFAKAYTNRATLYVQAGDLAKAEQDYKKASRLDEKLASAHLGLARVCHMSGRCDEALEHFNQALQLDPENPGTLCSRGDLLADMGLYAEALSSYAMAIEVEPSFGHAYRNGAWLLATCPQEQYRDPENAILGAKQALESEYGERHVALDTLAAALASAGQFDEAVKTLEEALEIAPAPSRPDYLARIKLYESGQPFRTRPIADVSQAMYEESDAE